MAEDAAMRIAELLHQVGEVHHVVFAGTHGNDDDWATFTRTGFSLTPISRACSRGCLTSNSKIPQLLKRSS
jgi:hypothetical protein